MHYYCLDMVSVTQEANPSKQYLLEKEEKFRGNYWKIFKLYFELSELDLELA